MIAILIGSQTHPITPFVYQWISYQTSIDDEIIVYFDHKEIPPESIVFALSYGSIISEQYLSKFAHTIILHASKLPHGRGWSPHIWSIIEGQKDITLSAISASKLVDSGEIWCQKSINICSTDLYDEINQKLFLAELLMIEHVYGLIANGVRPSPQPNIAPTYYRKRMPADSQVDPTMSIASIFDLLRVADPKRYPVFFYRDGVKFNLFIQKADG